MGLREKRVSLDKAVNAAELIKGRAIMSYLLSKEQLGFFGSCFIEDITGYICYAYSRQGVDRFLKLGAVLENNRPNTKGWGIFYRVYNEKLARICQGVVNA